MPAKPRRWFHITNNADAGKAEIKLRGYIGESKQGDPFWGFEGGAGTFKEFEDELEALGDVQELTLSIFSEGGDVNVGMGIHDLLRRHPAHKVCIIDGICASAATSPALACDEIKIPANAYFMIHNAQGGACGEANDLRSMAELLESVNANIADLYATRSGKSVDEIRELMDRATWLNGREAVEFGLADEVLNAAAVTNRASMATMSVVNHAAMDTMPREAAVWFDSKQHTSPRNAPPTTAPTPMKPTPQVKKQLANAAAKAAADKKVKNARAALLKAEAEAKALNKGKGAKNEGEEEEPANEGEEEDPPANKGKKGAGNKGGKGAKNEGEEEDPANEGEEEEPANEGEEEDPANEGEEEEPTNEGEEEEELANIANIVTRAVNAAVKPLRKRLENMEALQTSGVPSKRWGSAKPAKNAVRSKEGESQKPDLTGKTARQLINIGRVAMQAKPTLPRPTV